MYTCLLKLNAVTVLRYIRSAHSVTTQAELTHYYDSLTSNRFAPRSYPFQNIAMCKLKGFGIGCSTILTDEWPNFSCTAVFQPWTSTYRFPTRYQRSSRLMLLSSCKERFATFLHNSRLLQEGAMIAAIDSVTNEHLDHVAKTIFSSWQDTKQYKYDLFILVKDPKDMISARLNSERYFIDKLTADHADHITNYWCYGDYKDVPIIRKYLRNILTMYNFSVGVFSRPHPSNPISWMVYSDFGHTVLFHTIPEYQGSGFGEIVLDKFSSNLLENNLHPLGEYIKGSYLQKKFSHVAKCVPNYTWRDSITGKCYW